VIVYFVAMIAILAVAAAVVGLVLVGMEGRGRSRMPRIAEKLTRAAQHLNGEVDPPEAFTRVMERQRTADRRQQRERIHAGR
jgi:negative regulator of sigma E activity